MIYYFHKGSQSLLSKNNLIIKDILLFNYYVYTSKDLNYKPKLLESIPEKPIIKDLV